MKWHRLKAMARKEFLQIIRDPRSVAVVLLMPIMMMLAYGYGINLDAKHLPVYVLDREGSQQSQDFLKRFQASHYFELVKCVDSYPALIRAIDSQKCQLGIVVPWDFSRQIGRGGEVRVQALIDATDGNSANLAISYSQAVAQSYSSQIQLDWIRRQGLTPTAPPIAVEARTWFNENLESMDDIVPGVVVVVMAVIGTFLTALTIAREWERGTMEQLVSTPVSPSEVMLGKLAPYFAIGLLDTTLCALLGIWWFGVPFRGSWLVFFAGSALFLLAVSTIGYIFSVVAKSQLAASQISLLATFLPAFLLSGFIFPIDQMPLPVQAISHIFPALYFMRIVRNVFLKGAAVGVLLPDLAALAVFAAFLVLVATRIFKKRL